MDKCTDVVLSTVCDHKKYEDSVKYMSEMFEREVFDEAIIAYSTGINVASAAISVLKRDPIIFKDGGFINNRQLKAEDMKGKRCIVMGDMLTSGSVAGEILKIVSDNGGKVIKLGFLVEDSQFSARKKYLKGYPVESMTIL